MEEGEIKPINLSEGEKKGISFSKVYSSKISLGIAILIILGIILFVSLRVLTQYESCKSWDCFNENLATCTKTKFAGGAKVLFPHSNDIHLIHDI